MTETRLVLTSRVEGEGTCCTINAGANHHL